MSKKRNALGRGLSALIPENSINLAEKDAYRMCPIEEIAPQPGQPRRFFDDRALCELVASIKEQGIIQPLVVRPFEKSDSRRRDQKPTSAPTPRYVLIAGERRWRAAQKSGLHEVPVVIRSMGTDQAFELALVENIQRQDLNPIEEAEAYQRLLDDHGYTQEKVAKRVGKERSTVANSLRLLRLPEGVQAAVSAQSISAGHARALLALISHPGELAALFKRVVTHGLSVRQTEVAVAQMRDAAKVGERISASGSSPNAGDESGANCRDLEERLSRSLGTRVRLVTGKGKRGRIEISYASMDELDRILDSLL